MSALLGGRSPSVEIPAPTGPIEPEVDLEELARQRRGREKRRQGRQSLIIDTQPQLQIQPATGTSAPGGYGLSI